ncbi:hypothetical protein EN45_051200 [Penicillium chrysogenum]|uniref:Uncharacterized protein n=1 Tax=Penicillium chrysogenum TaxID=5076 RepID=A0A167RYN4_PENCH|nr:uncharacterized protein N7525_009568 [Penicillium rubens]KAJ5831315.1 hypothetical protein N7525_009568 [Penicillium rubens]KAJ5854859.1 hypothetical protein N7534_007402 [Penicillium rubens]KZN86587.1 hypothetical protein EN45_051200 [Penicillium chrysogenum]
MALWNECRGFEHPVKSRPAWLPIYLFYLFHNNSAEPICHSNFQKLPKSSSSTTLSSAWIELAQLHSETRDDAVPVRTNATTTSKQAGPRSGQEPGQSDRVSEDLSCVCIIQRHLAPYLIRPDRWLG